MADKNDERYIRKEPPAESEWPHIFDGIEKSHKMWLIVGPIHAVASNWKALAVIFLVVAWMNSPEIISFLEQVRGGLK